MKKRQRIPPLQVCKSAAGFYVGRWCPEEGPYSRNSKYYNSTEEAQKALDTNDYWRDSEL